MRPAKATSKKHDGLSMKIYSALLGGLPDIAPRDGDYAPRLKMRVRIEARIEHRPVSPFRQPTLRDSVERYAAYAAQAINDAHARLTAARSTVSPRTREQPKATPVVLIGPSVRRSKSLTRTPTSAAA